MRTRRFRVLVIVAGLALFAAPVRTQDDHRDQLPNSYKVNDALYRGGQPKPGGWELLRQLGIKTVINLRDADTKAEVEEEDVLSAGLQYFNVPFARWGRPEDRDMAQVLSIINDPANQPVFVHCQHGADRTGVVIAVYRVSHDGWTSHRARDEAKRFGLKPWQLGMKDYIQDYEKRKTTSPTVPETNDR
jgi:protein tyrosine/serine phosphatase